MKLHGNSLEHEMKSPTGFEDRESSLSVPPPPYSKETNQIEPKEKDIAIDGSSSGSSQISRSQVPSRTLHFRAHGVCLSNIRVLDSDKTTLAYTVSFNLRKPHLRIASASTDIMIGSANYHALTTRIDATVNDNPIALKSNGFFSCSYSFASPALGGKILTWKSKRWSVNLTCYDEQDVPLAKYTFNSWSLRKCGKLELYGSEVDSGPLFEELLVTAGAMVEYVLMTNYATVTAAGS